MLLLLTLCSFAANLGGRYFDPLVTIIARDFLAPTAVVAKLALMPRPGLTVEAVGSAPSPE